MIKRSIQEEDITVVNIYVPNIGAPQYIRQMLTVIKGEIDSNTVIVEGASLVAQWLRIHLPSRGHGFKPWSGKIPHATEQLSPCATTTDPAL